ncbi:MAG: ribosome biogenesis/translation initiation ATPase RLI [Candidatus Atabeyarchaeum deiterrae]
MPRVVILNRDRCKSKDCGRPCIKYCPRVRAGDETIVINPGEEYPYIAENLCSGEGICVKKCPFGALRVVNTPETVEGELIHRYGPNMFELYRLPIPRAGKVTGLVGPNGAGKTTALRILAGEIKPNLGKYNNPPDWSEIIRFYRGSELQGYFEKMEAGKLKVIHKPQYITKLPNVVKGEVKQLLQKADERGVSKELMKELGLTNVADRDISVLSGGELQRVAVAATLERDFDVYLLDEPSSYLDVKERIIVAKTIRSVAELGKTVVTVEHDLAMLDLLSDYVCMFYGEPGAFGVISHPYGVREGINAYLDGFITDENVRFRTESVRFDVRPAPVGTTNVEDIILKFEPMTKKLGDFTLSTQAGDVRKGETIGILGPNGIGKTTFVKLLACMVEPDEGISPPAKIKVSYKPQYLSADFDGTVMDLLKSAAGKNFSAGAYDSEVIQPLELRPLLDRMIKELSGGELQKVAIAACLSREADLYLLDEPSAYIDAESRLAVAKMIRRNVEKRGNAAFVVEHDIMIVDWISDRLMVFAGEPSIRGVASAPMDLRTGMNMFLRELGITYRRDIHSGRPRVNKENSRLDTEQKAKGEYYYVA